MRNGQGKSKNHKGDMRTYKRDMRAHSHSLLLFAFLKTWDLLSLASLGRNPRRRWIVSAMQQICPSYWKERSIGSFICASLPLKKIAYLSSNLNFLERLQLIWWKAHSLVGSLVSRECTWVNYLSVGGCSIAEL